MTFLIVAALAFLGLHLLVAGTGARQGIVRVIGEKPYLGLFSLMTMTSLVGLCFAYGAAYHSPENIWLYDTPQSVKDIGIYVLGVVFVLFVPGMFGSNFNAGATAGPIKTSGVLAITRHPFLWAVFSWALYHLIANGDLASVILFTTFVLLPLVGTFSIDAKLRARNTPGWEAFTARTSNIPFAGLIRGRSTLVLKDIFDKKLAWALAVFLVLLLTHTWLFGASPFPQGFVPSFALLTGS